MEDAECKQHRLLPNPLNTNKKSFLWESLSASFILPAFQMVHLSWKIFYYIFVGFTKLLLQFLFSEAVKPSCVVYADCPSNGKSSSVIDFQAAS